MNARRTITPNLNDLPVCLNPDGQADIVLLCEHASNRIPEGWNDLGLQQQHLETHHAWDAGAADLTRALSEMLDATAILAGVSRLFLDYNRPARHPLQFPARIDGIEVPGNQNLDDAEIAERERLAYVPLYDVAEEVLNVKSLRKPPIFVTVHTCETEWDGARRPWPIGIISEWDRRLAVPLVEHLQQAQDEPVGDNEPYDGRVSIGNTLMLHAGGRRLLNAALELRKDVLETQEGIARWSEIIADGLRKITY